MEEEVNPPVTEEELEGKLLTTAEVAAMFKVDPKTVARWAKAGRLTSIRTVGGHRRFLESRVKAFKANSLQVATQPLDQRHKDS